MGTWAWYQVSHVSAEWFSGRSACGWRSREAQHSTKVLAAPSELSV